MLKEFLGFVVLTGPLFLAVLWLPISIWLAWRLTKRLKIVVVRVVVGLAVFALVMLAPVADEIVGRAYFKHLCASEAGVKIYKTVELPADYWDEQGRPRFLEENGNFHLGNAFPIEYKTEVYSSIFHVDNLGYQLMNGQSGQVLSEVKDYMYWGGWVRRKFSSHNTADSCRGRAERFLRLIQQSFEPKKS